MLVDSAGLNHGSSCPTEGVPAAPSKVAWTAHAEIRAARIGWSHADAGQLVLSAFTSRRKNRGAAAWRVETRGTVFVFDWPDEGDVNTLRLVTLWNRR